MFHALVVVSFPALAHGAACHLPVVPLRPGLLPAAEAPTPWTWLQAFGISRQTWKAITGGDERTSEHLHDLVEKGLVDYADRFTAQFPTEVQWQEGFNRKRVWRVMRSVLEEPAVGEIYGNALVAESVPLFHLLAPLPPGLPVVDFADEVETMRRLLSAFGRTSRNYRSEKTRRCIELLERGAHEENRPELCKSCKAFFSCRQSENATRLVRATLTSCQLLQEQLALQPCWAVRILDLGSLRCLDPRTLKILVSTFPELRVLRVQHESYEELPTSADAERTFWPTLQGLEIQFATPLPPAWLCELRGLRRLDISATDRGAMIALPTCLGNLTELIHLNVVRNNLRGVSSLPSSLHLLSELRSFEAFENGATGEMCDAQVPERELCVPGYVARSEGERPNWRCPQAGWKIRLEDRSLPWWHWRKIEKMHIDANFIFGNIPDDIPDYWPRLRSLDLHDLQLTGPLPRSLVRLENLTQLQVQLNDLECGVGEEDVVAELLRLPKMRTLNVDANPRLCGCVPSRTRVDLNAQVGETQIEVGCSEKGEL